GGRLEHLGVGNEAGGRAPALALWADLLDRTGRLPTGIFLGPDRAVAGRFDAHPRGQRVDDADADAVQTAGDLVAATTELPARVEDCVDDLEGILAGRVLSDRDTAAVVGHGDLAVRRDGHVDGRRLAGHSLLDGFVDAPPDEVMQAPCVCRADVHPRPLPDRLE